MTQKELRLGSVGQWIWVRGAEAVTWLLFMNLLIGQRRVPGLGLTAVVFFVVLVWVSFIVHPTAYGHANERGISFRQYLRRRFVPWHEIEVVESSRAGLKLFVRRSGFLRRTLKFYANASLKTMFKEWSRAMIAEPEFVKWLNTAVEEGRTGRLEIRVQPRKNLIQWLNERVFTPRSVVEILLGLILFLLVLAMAKRWF